MQWRVPLADVEMTDADIDAIAATYRSGWLSMGPRIAEFEAAFAEYAGARARGRGLQRHRGAAPAGAWRPGSARATR